MWWIKGRGHAEGPFDADELKRRISLGQFGRYDRVSRDRTNWVYLKDTDLWQPTRPQTGRGRVVHVPLTVEWPVRKVEEPALPPSSVPLPKRLEKPVQTAPSGRCFPLYRLVALGACLCLGTLLLGGGGVWLALSGRQAADTPLQPANKVRAGADDGHKVEPSPTNEVVRVVGPTNTVRFADVKDKVVVIGNEGKGGGSAFLLKDGGKTWLVTNEHVTRGNRDDFRHVMLIDGRELDLGRFEVAEDRDLARFEVLGNCASFALAAAVPNVGDRLSIYGNSLAGGAITELKGCVKSIGPLRLEVDAEFVSGNSGSAVLNERGEVIGVVSYMRNNKVAEGDKKDWGTRGTQFDAVRRFAVRFTNVRWRAMPWEDYLRQSEKAHDLVHFLYRLYPLLDADCKDFDEKDYAFGLVYEKVTGRMFKVYNEFEQDLVDLSSAWSAWWNAKVAFERVPEDEAHADEKRHCARAYIKRGKEFCAEKVRVLKQALETLKAESWIRQIQGEMVINGFGSVERYERILNGARESHERDIRRLSKILKEEE